MTTHATKHQRLEALRPLAPAAVASIAAAWDVRMVHESNSTSGSTPSDPVADAGTFSLISAA